MSTIQKTNILNYLPLEEKKKLIELISRLGEETKAKEKYLALYEQAKQQVDELTRTCNLLKDENSHLKQQIHNSFSMVAQIRTQFRQNRQKRSTADPKIENDWQDLSDSDLQQNEPSTGNHLNSMTLPPRQHYKSPIDRYRQPKSTSKKPYQILNISESQLSQSNLNTSASKQIIDLRNQVRALQESKREKSEKERQIRQKLKLVNEIKSRYLNEEKSKEKDIQKIDISNTFDEESHPSSRLKKIPPAKKVDQQLKEINFEKNINRKSEQTPKSKIYKKQNSGLIENQSMSKHNQISGHIITVDDYSDVLDLINDFN